MEEMPLAGEDGEMIITVVKTTKQSEFVPDGPPIYEPLLEDVLNGRGAFVNAHKGNQKFRALCFTRKSEFDAANHAAKRRISVEIVDEIMGQPGRFLKRKEEKGPWFELTREKGILKAQQVMRDFQRPDRVERRKKTTPGGTARKRQRTVESTPGASEVVCIDA